MKICSKRTKLHHLKKFSWGSMPPTSLANAWLRHASQVASRHATCPAPQKVGPPLANPAYAHGLLLRNYLKRSARRIHAGRQLSVCSTLYVYALQNLFSGQKND